MAFEQPLPLPKPLTARENEIMSLLAGGLSNPQIARELTLAVSTVKWYVRQIYAKLGAADRSQAVARAVSLSLVSEQAVPTRPRHNLPAAVTPFVGRDQELSSLTGLLSASECRLVTILGPAGIGKTRLGLAAAELLISTPPPARGVPLFPDGVFFVALAPLEEAGHIVSAVAEAISFPLRGNGRAARPAGQQLLDYLKNRRMLILLDNFEHLPDGVDLLSQIVQAAPGVRLLVTAQEPLRLRGEQQFPLQGMLLPDQALVEPNGLLETPAARLFLNAALRAQPGFRVVGSDIDHLARICRLVDGIPLGIELAASWVTVLSLADIAAEIEQGLDFLTSDLRDAPPRQSSMRAALDTSFRRLDQSQQAAVAALSVFRGGFTRTAALDVAGAALPVLVALSRKSWLTYDRDEARYTMHQMLRQYGADVLAADRSAEAEVRGRHAAFYCALLSGHDSDWTGRQQRAVVEELRPESKNIRLAWDWAVSRGQIAQLSQGLESLCRFYQWEGRHEDGRRVCSQAAAALGAIVQSDDGSQVEIPCLAARVLAWESRFAWDPAEKRDLLDSAEAYLRQALPHCCDTSQIQALIQLWRGDAALHTDRQLAGRRYEEALALFGETGSEWGRSESLRGLGAANWSLGRLDQAAAPLETSLDLCRQRGDRLGEADVLLVLGLLVKHQADLDQAEALHSRSLSLYQQLGHRYRALSVMGSLAYTCLWSGNFSEGQLVAVQAVEAYQELGGDEYIYPLGALAAVTLHRGQYDRARKFARQSQEAARRRVFPQDVGWACMYLGVLDIVQGENERALHTLQESHRILRGIGQNLAFLPLAFRIYAALAIDDGPLAGRLLNDALTAALDTGVFFPVIHCLPAAALMAAGREDLPRAVELYALAGRYGYVGRSHWFADVAGKSINRAAQALPKTARHQAEARGAKLDLWSTAAGLSRELAR